MVTDDDVFNIDGKNQDAVVYMCVTWPRVVTVLVPDELRLAVASRPVHGAQRSGGPARVAAAKGSAAPASGQRSAARADDIPEWILQESRGMAADREKLWTHFAMTEILAQGCPPLVVSERVADDGTCGWRSLAAALHPHQDWTAIRTTTLLALDDAARQAQRWRITASRCAAQGELQVQRCDMALADSDEQLSEHLNQELAGYRASATKHATLMIMAVAAWLHHHHLVCVVPAAVHGDRSAVVHTREWLRKEDLKERFDSGGAAETWPAVHVALINARNPSSSGSLNHYVPLRPLGDGSDTTRARECAGVRVAAVGTRGADGAPARADIADAGSQRSGDMHNPDISTAPRTGRQDATVRPPAQRGPATIAPPGPPQSERSAAYLAKIVSKLPAAALLLTSCRMRAS